ncbi:MAG: hypothetical protein JXQ83_06290 [Candidatus Glassbacteria bacterium]|nr:hypothetical protein [Candidatus Glassbacteria bacterium]
MKKNSPAEDDRRDAGPEAGGRLSRTTYQCALCGAGADAKDNICAPEKRRDEELLLRVKKRR